MAKTYNNLFDQVVDFDNLWQSYLAARKGKRYHTEVGKYTARLEHNLIDTRDRLLAGLWAPGPAREFRVYEPKWRDIQAPPFEDRVVHHALVRVVEPLFDRRFIHHSYACRTDKGAQRAVAAVQRMMRTAASRWATPYVLKGDVSKYFASIDHRVLAAAVRRVVSCKRTLALWETITKGYGHTNGFGVPVGALTSQLTGNIVMDQFDHAMTDHVGAGMYVRYMDDFVILAPSKTAASALLARAEEQLAVLNLRLNPKSCYFPASRGVDFAGYRTWTTHVLPRKRNIRKARRNFKRMATDYAAGRIGLDFIQPRIASFLAYTKHCQAADTVAGVLSDFTLQRSAQ